MYRSTLKSQKTLIASIFTILILISMSYFTYTFLQTHYTSSLEQSEKELASISLSILQIPYSKIQIYKNESQYTVSLYNPSDKPLNLSTLYYAIEDENGKTVCHRKLDPTQYSTTTGKEILYPKKQITVIINTSECKLDPDKKYRICLIGNGKICSDLEYPSESLAPLPPITPISQLSKGTIQQPTRYSIPSNAIAINSCTVISQSGYYILTNDIINTATSPCINIAANNVTLDCLGHIIDGTGASSYGIEVYRYPSQATNITIKNCKLQDWIMGIYLYYVNRNKLENITATLNVFGIYSQNSNYNIFQNITAINNYYGIYLSGSDFNTIVSSRIENNEIFGGIGFADASQNSIYNNYFNNSINITISGITYPNTWNTTKTPGINIVGGNYLGGNYWGSPNGKGFSDTCTDVDNDGICDTPFVLANNNIDYLPLAKP